MTETVRCPKCQGALWNDMFSKAQPAQYRFTCLRCNYGIKISGCRDCKTPTMKLVHGVEEGGPHRPFFRFQCTRCGREIRLQGDVYAP